MTPQNFYDKLGYLGYYMTKSDNYLTYHKILYDKTGYHAFSSQKQYDHYEARGWLCPWQQDDSNDISHQ